MMKRMYLTVALQCGSAAIALVALAACGGDRDSAPGSDYVCTSCVAAPEAAPADDELRSGVFKGIIVDVDDIRSLSGTLKAVIASDETTGRVEITVDGTTHTSSTYVLNASPVGDVNSNGVADPGEGALHSFEGDTFTFDLTVSEVGEVVDTVLEWDGESARAVVVKETSTMLVECFEGSWSGTVGSSPIDGVWNFVAAGSALTGAYDSGFFGGSGTFVATFDGAHVTVLEDDGDPLASGDRTNDYVGGAWEKASNDARGTWSGTRQL